VLPSGWKDSDVVGGELPVGRHDREALELCLRNEHPVEGVLVMKRQRSGGDIETAQSTFDRRLPDRHRADKHVVCGSHELVARFLAEAAWLPERQQQRVRVEKKPQGSRLSV